MDPSNSAQDIVRCELCEDAIVQMYCDFCDVNLCIPCIGKHISDDYYKHKVVQFERRKTTLIYPKCTKHTTKSCEFHCKDCNISLCSFCTTLNESHKEHTISTLYDVYKLKRELIGKDTEELEKIISLTFEEIASDLKTQLANLEGGYEKLTLDVSKYGDDLQREINIIVDKMKLEIQNYKNQHMNFLKAYLEEINKRRNDIEKTQRNLCCIEESNKIAFIMAYCSKNEKLRELPIRVKVLQPTFNPKAINTEQLKQLFGSLTPLFTKRDKNGYKLKKSEKFTKELLKEPKLLTTINTGYESLRCVTLHSGEEIWTSARETCDMKCFNIQGSILKTIKTKSGKWPKDIAIIRNGDLLYSDWSARTVNKVNNEQTEVLIRLQDWTPSNLCNTSSGDLLVTMYSDDHTQSKVVRYSNYKEKQTIQFDDKGQSLYSGNTVIKFITENRNLDICVADCEAHAVIVVNQSGNLRFRYTGHPSTTNDRPFKPFGITTDSQGQILTANFKNHCIHILDKDGLFLSYIQNCDLKDPYGLCVDKSDDLFVAECYTRNVKKIKYLQ